MARLSLCRAAVDKLRPPPRRTRRRVAYGLASLSLVLGLSLGLRELGPATPSVPRAAVWTDTVRRGPMVREVLGQGKLVPVEIRWLTAKSNAQVERVRVKPGAEVHADSVVVELVNSDLELAALEADRQLSGAQAELVNLQATLDAGRLGQESTVATLRSELDAATRRARADEELARKGFLSELERGQTLGRANELGGRLAFEEKRLLALGSSSSAQISAQRAQIERLASIAEFRHREVEGLKLRAGVDGVLQELSLQQGQSVAAGALLGKVIRPDRLQAEILIPETQAKDLELGQPASIDTRNGVIAGHVLRIDPAAQAGTVRVDVALDAALPAGARPDMNVEGTIQLERLASVLLVRRPAVGQPGTRVSLFKLDGDGTAAQRTPVTLGRSSVASVEIVSGLDEGDRVILSELSEWDDADRIRLQ